VFVSVQQQMKFPQFILHALIGLLGSAVGSLALGLIWPLVFPGSLHPERFVGGGPSTPNLVLYVMIVAFVVGSPFSLVAGIVGGRIITEGGRREQLVAAAILGFLVMLPLAGCSFWVLTGS
jgi:hypothetical protein